MSRAEWMDVVEGEYMLVLVDLLARQLPAEDPGEDISVVVRLGRVDGHTVPFDERLCTSSSNYGMLAR